MNVHAQAVLFVRWPETWHTERWHHLLIVHWRSISHPACTLKTPTPQNCVSLLASPYLDATFLDYAAKAIGLNTPHMYQYMQVDQTGLASPFVFWWCQWWDSENLHCGHSENFQASHHSMWIRCIDHLCFDLFNLSLVTFVVSTMLHISTTSGMCSWEKLLLACFLLSNIIQ